MERIRGPVNGYYVASYACRVGDLGDEFVGYTKLCSVRPRSFWDAEGEITYGNTRFPDEREAMDNSETLALDRVAQRH
jgi:hypothetical protein